MARRHYAVYMLVGDPNVFVYTSTDNDNTLALLEDLGFTHQYTAFAYGWDCTKGHLYSVPKYFNMVTTNRMVLLVRINNDTDVKIREIYKEVCIVKGVARKRWYEHYSAKNENLL